MYQIVQQIYNPDTKLTIQLQNIHYYMHKYILLILIIRNLVHRKCVSYLSIYIGSIY